MSKFGYVVPCTATQCGCVADAEIMMSCPDLKDLCSAPTDAPAPAPPSGGGGVPSPAPEPAPMPAPVPPPPSSGGDAWVNGTFTTGYWDCCKPSCSWPGKGKVDKPVLACDATTGEVLSDALAQSACQGGPAASCANNKPFLVRPRLSMGFAAAAVSGSHGLTGDDNCGQCYELRFVAQKHDPDGDNWGGSHPDLAGKSMVIQVTNIGYDVNGKHSFDLQIPGAGQGAFSDGCTAQFPGYSVGDFDCDNRYGGCHTKAGCARLPDDLRSGCEWRYDWYRWLIEAGQTNNPYVNYRRVRCPSQLTSISGSVPLDDAAFPAIDIDAYGSPESEPVPESNAAFLAEAAPHNQPYRHGLRGTAASSLIQQELTCHKSTVDLWEEPAEEVDDLPASEDEM